MARLAIFIDAGYSNALARDTFKLRIDYDEFRKQIHQVIADNTVEPLDLLRTYYYDCLPYQSNPPTPEESGRMSRERSFFAALRNLSSFAVREGRLAFRGHDANGQPIFQQKGVDLLLGLDFALLSAKHQITHAAVVSGDSDLIPAFEAAQQEGIKTWHIHGPERSYARELWQKADDRFEMTPEFMATVARKQS